MGTRLVHKSAPAARRTRRSQPYSVAEAITVIKVRFHTDTGETVHAAPFVRLGAAERG